MNLVLIKEFGNPERSESLGGIEVGLFRDVPYRGLITFATGNLSAGELRFPSGKAVKMEMLLCAQERFLTKDLGAVLALVATDARRTGTAPARGAVLGPAGPLYQGGELEAFYVARPIYFSSRIQHGADTMPPTVFAWLVPIHRIEAEFISSHGWQEFEDQLARTDSDVTALDRVPIVDHS